MSPRRFILNDWLLHDLLGDNGSEAQAESVQLLQRLKEGPDSIAFLAGSSWARKAHQLMQCRDPLRRGISKYLHLNILRDSEKCRVIQPAETTPLPPNLVELVPPDDHYLFECYYAAEADLLMTSDARLVEKISGLEILVQIRDAFLDEYLSQAE